MAGFESGECRKKPLVVSFARVPRGPCRTADDFVAWGRFGSWMGAGGPWRLADGVGSKVEIETLEGTMTAKPGDYVIRGVKGELYPVRQDIFEETQDILSRDQW